MATLLSTQRMSISEALEALLREPLPVRFTAYDGSSTGDPDSPLGLRLANERGLAYLLTAPGELGMVRAYVSGDLVAEGVHPADPGPFVEVLMGRLALRAPGLRDGVRVLRSVGWEHLRPPEPPAIEHPPRWRRIAAGTRHAKPRDASAVQHHYDVSNRFYELLLGPSMTYSCAVYPTAGATLEEAQLAKYDLIARKLDLRPGTRLLDIGCGWGGFVRFAAREYGARALGVTLSPSQVAWGSAAIEREGLAGSAEVRLCDYRDVLEDGFDAVSSVGMAEHVGVRQLPTYFNALAGRVRDGGRVLNHCITRPHNHHQATAAVMDRYVFPDGELTGVGTVVARMQDAGLELQHVENLREHYALTLRAWTENLREHWDACVAEAGEPTARVWGLYLAGSRIAFERNALEVHQALGGRTPVDGTPPFGLRPTW